MTIGSLFAGIGGIDLGFEQAGFRAIWANDINKNACKTYRYNFPNVNLYECDIRSLDPRTYIVAFKSQKACDSFRFPEKCELQKHLFDVIDKTVKGKDRYYVSEGSYEHNRLSAAITDDKQIYRFSDYGIQASKDGISFTLKANMGTWKNRVPYIKDNFGIRKITPYECLALQRFPNSFKFPDIPIASAYKQCGNSLANDNLPERGRICLFKQLIYFVASED